MFAIGILATAASMIYASVSFFPTSAVICVPLGFGDEVRDEIDRNGIFATRDRVSRFNTQYFRSLPGCGIQVWLSQSELFNQATKNGYYCHIEYTSLRGTKWEREVGNSRMIGLQ